LLNLIYISATTSDEISPALILQRCVGGRRDPDRFGD